MKKILSIALVALLAASTVFAGFTGKAAVGLGYNLETKAYGFSNSTESTVTFELSSEEAGAEAEGSVFAGIKGSFTIAIDDYDANEEGTPDWVVSPSIDEAYVKGEGWSVSILGAQEGQDFATSALDKYSKDKALKASTVKVDAAAAPGVTATYKDWTVSAGFASAKTTPDNVNEAEYYYSFVGYDEDGNGTQDSFAGTEEELNAYVVGRGYDSIVIVYQFVKTPAVPGVKEDYVDYSFTVATPEFAFGDVKATFGAAVADAGKDAANLGLSAKVAYANDQLSASVASDVVLAGIGNDKVGFDADVAAKFAFAPVTVDAYYATKVLAQPVLEPNKKAANAKVENLLSAKVSADLSSFDVPVTVAVYGRDILGKQVLGVSANASVDALTVGASFDYGVKAEAYLVGASASYKFDAFTVAAGINYRSADEQLYANASIETTSLIPGATLKLAYGPTSKDGKVTSNLLKEKYGQIDATCTIAF